MGHKHHQKHSKPHLAAHPAARKPSIGMVKQRAGLASMLAGGIVIFISVMLLALVAYWLFN